MDYESDLNSSQLAAVKAVDGACLVLAGAGSGKTRVLTYRVAYLIENCGVDPYNILAITFTNKAAGEMKERIAAIPGSDGVWVSTFHSLATKILRREISSLEGYTSDFTIYAESESKAVCNLLTKDLDKNDFIKKELRGIVSAVKNSGESVEKYVLDHAMKDGNRIEAYFNKYNETLKNNNALDFDDLLIKLEELFETAPEVLKKYATRFKYINVDEFQDTNRIQYRIVSMLSSVHGNLFVVGDEDQSIYGWRGADINNILDFKKDFPSAKLFKLEENYRSSTAILSAANRLIAHNSQRIGKTLRSTKTDGVRVEVRYCDRDFEEAEYVATNIYGLRRNGYNYGDIAILVRVNALTRSFEQKLTNYGIPYVVYGGMKFFDRAEVKDVLAYLCLTVNTRDNVAFERVVNLPTRGIGQTSLDKLREVAERNSCSMFDAVELLTTDDMRMGTIQKFLDFRRLIEHFIEKVDKKDLVPFVNDVLDEVDFRAAYKEDEAEIRMENIKEFVAAVNDFAAMNPGAKLSDFLQSVTLSTDIDEDDGADDRVKLATVHSVKGLEFKVVFMVGMEEGCFPISRAETRDEVEEERRICYVAITRARERLYVTYTGQRFRFNRYEYNLPSRFIEELTGAKLVGNRILDYSPKPQTQTGRTVVSKPNYTGMTKPGTTFAREEVKPSTSQASQFRVHDHVVHKTFGKGMIIKLEYPVAHVAFESVGIKQLNLNFAPMKKLD